MKLKLYVFGNEFIEQDSLAKEIAKDLNIDIHHCRSPDELLEEDNILILDVVKGIKEPLLITDINQIKTRKMTTLHDFDLGFFLSLVNEMGIKKNIKIIGIPSQGNKGKITKRIEKWLEV